MSNIFLDKIKVAELSRFFITQYSYREVEIKKVEGIFIENRSAKYPLIRISNQRFEGVEEFNEDLAVMKKVVGEYSVISKIEDVKCLCIYFDGFVEGMVDNIYSVVIKDNEDIANSTILSSEFPQISQFDLNKVNNFVDNGGKHPTENTSNTQEKKITDMFSLKEINKKTKFSRYFAIAFVVINFMAVYWYSNPFDFLYNLSYYEVFTIQLQQYYRFFTGLFLNNGLLYILAFGYLFFQYNTFVELKLGTKKTMLIYGIGLIMILASMFFIGAGQVFVGSYPILTLTAGTYLGVLLLPSERGFLKLNLRNIFFVVLIVILFAFGENTNLIGALISFFTGLVCTFAFDLKEKQINRNYFISIILVFVCMVALRFIPGQTLPQNFTFERDYIAYIKDIDKELGLKYQDILSEHYKDIGAIEYE